MHDRGPSGLAALLLQAEQRHDLIAGQAGGARTEVPRVRRRRSRAPAHAEPVPSVDDGGEPFEIHDRDVLRPRSERVGDRDANRLGDPRPATSGATTSPWPGTVSDRSNGTAEERGRAARRPVPTAPAAGRRCRPPAGRGAPTRSWRRPSPGPARPGRRRRRRRAARRRRRRRPRARPPRRPPRLGDACPAAPRETRSPPASSAVQPRLLDVALHALGHEVPDRAARLHARRGCPSRRSRAPGCSSR